MLGLEAIQSLGIDLNYHARFHTHKRVQYMYSVEEMQNHCDEQLKERIHEYAAPLTSDDLLRVCNLSERVIKEYLETHEGEYERKPIRLESIGRES